MSKTVHVRMAKATSQDLEVAKDILRILEDDEDPTFREARIVRLMRKNPGSLSRVVWGMSTILDPDNKVVNPDSDVLELHPSLVRKEDTPPT